MPAYKYCVEERPPDIIPVCVASASKRLDCAAVTMHMGASLLVMRVRSTWENAYRLPKPEFTAAVCAEASSLPIGIPYWSAAKLLPIAGVCVGPDVAPTYRMAIAGKRGSLLVLRAVTNGSAKYKFAASVLFNGFTRP